VKILSEQMSDDQNKKQKNKNFQVLEQKSDRIIMVKSISLMEN